MSEKHSPGSDFLPLKQRFSAQAIRENYLFDFLKISMTELYTQKFQFRRCRVRPGIHLYSFKKLICYSDTQPVWGTSSRKLSFTKYNIRIILNPILQMKLGSKI